MKSHDLNVISLKKTEVGYTAEIAGYDEHQQREFKGEISIIERVYRGELIDPRRNSLSASMINWIKTAIGQLIRYEYEIFPRFKDVRRARINEHTLETRVLIKTIETNVEFRLDEFELSGGELETPITFKFNESIAETILIQGYFDHTFTIQKHWVIQFAK